MPISEQRDDPAGQAGRADRSPQRVAVSGASGLIGGRLCAFLSAGGHTVHRLVRGTPDPERGDIPWDPARGGIDAGALEGLAAVVHLAGENLAAGRWNAARKAAIRESRVAGTALLCRALAGLDRKPRVLISASAVGWYGNRGEREVDEDSPPGEGFLAEVCREWEHASESARQAGIRVINLRIGMVLAMEGGALARMLLPFRLGLGGAIGNGRQMMSWIALEDLVRAMDHLLFAEPISGPVNAVAPDPRSNRDFARALGRVLHRPALLPLPAPAVGLLFGEMGRALLLEGQRVLPRRLLQSGYSFLHPRLEEALCAELGLPPPAL